MRDTVVEVRTNSLMTLSYGPFHMDVQVLDDQLELILNSSVRTQDVVLKIYWKQGMIEMNGERERERERERENLRNSCQ